MDLHAVSDNFLRILAIVAGIGFLIFVHEFGHFLMAKRNGVRVEIFSLGFGNPIWKVVRGDTEYRLAWIPLGGYVKMAGEPLGEDRKGEPDELSSKSPGQRFQIFIAGIVMNFLFAFPICILSYVVGKNVGVPIVGEMPGPDTPEWEAGLLPGDRLVSVNDVPVTDWEGYRRELLRATRGKTLTLVIQRGDPPCLLPLPLVPSGADSIGVMPPVNVVDRIEKGSPGEQAGLRPGDEIRSYNGRPVFDIASDVTPVTRRSGGRSVSIDVYRPSEERVISTRITPAPGEPVMAVFNPDEVVGEPLINRIHPFSCIRDHVQEGDRIVSIDEIPVFTDRDVTAFVETWPERPLAFEIRRDATFLTFVAAPRRSVTGKGKLDVILGGQGLCVLGAIPAGSSLAVEGAAEGDRVLAVDGRPTPTVGWVQRYVKTAPHSTVEVEFEHAGVRRKAVVPVERNATGQGAVEVRFMDAFPRLVEVPAPWPMAAVLRRGDRILRIADEDGKMKICAGLDGLNKVAKGARRPFRVEIEREGRTETVELTPASLSVPALSFVPRYRTMFRRYPLGEAVVLGSEEVIDIVRLTFQMLWKMITREEPASAGLSGFIGIVQAAHHMTYQGTGNFLWFLAILSVSLAIFNLFPIPILDGGHILFLAIEKFKGSPVSEKTLIRAQYVGLVFLFSLLIVVTTFDILRLRGH